MKRILYSCLVLVSLCLTGSLSAQLANFSITPNVMCYNVSNVYTAQAGTQAHSPGATTYSWVITSPNPSLTPTFSTASTATGAPTNSVIDMSFNGCGIYTVTCFAWNGLFFPPALVNTIIQTMTIICPSGAGISATPSVVCTQSNVTFSGSGATTYTWTYGNPTLTATGNPLTFTPSVNTCATFIGTSVFNTPTGTIGCIVTPSANACVSVQALTATVSPASQTMCAGSPVSFTATSNVVANPSVTPGTSLLGYTWLDPSSNTLTSTTSIASATAASGNYSVGVIHAGAAGTCIAYAQAAVVIGTNIPVSLTSSSTNGSLCPNQCVTLTAVSIQSAATSYSWTQSAGFPTNIGNTGTYAGTSANGSTVNMVRCPGPGSFPRTYTVDLDYFGCPGQATLTLYLLTLTPTLTASSGLSSCPGRSITLTGSGGVTYTFSAIPSAGTNTTALPKPTATTATHTPTFSNFPISYVVSTASAGCVGSTTITVVQRTLQPILTCSSLSVCPGTEFTLSSTVNGTSTASGSTYTFISPFVPSLIGSGTASFALYTPPSPAGTVFPQTYTVSVDSAGCSGSGTLTVNLLTLKPILSSSSPSICAGTQFTLNSTGGANTSYSFTASDPQFTNSPTSTFIDALTTNSVTHIPASSLTLISFTVDVDSAGCRGSDTHSIGILDLGPTLTLTPSSFSICPGTAISFSASGARNYSFISPAPASTVFGAGITSSNASIITATDATSPLSFAPFKVYTVLGDSGGCVGTKTIAIYERVLQPQISITPPLVCKGQTITICASGISNNTSTPTTYTFVATPPIPSFTIPSPATSSCVPYSPTVQTVFVAVADSANCKGITPTVTVYIRPDLPLLTTASSASVCPGMTATLSVSGPTAATSIQYTWTQTVGSGSLFPTNPAFTKTVTVNPITPSTYSIFALDSLGCVGNTVVNVGIDPAISFSIGMASSGSTICAGTSVSLSANSTASANTIGTIVYTWTPGAGITPTIGNMVIASPSASTIYTATGNNGYGCFAQNTVAVPVGQYPILSSNSTANGVCPGFTSTLTAFGANNYTWTGTSFTNVIAQQSISVGPGNYTIVGSNGGSCTSTLFPVVVTQLNPSSTIPISITVSSPTTCITSNFPKFSKSVHLSAFGAGTYVWFPYNPSYMTYSLGSQTDVRPPATTQYTVIGSTAVCSNTQVVTVNVINQFSMNVTPPLPAICLGDSLKLNITNIGQPSIPAFTYSWTEALNAPPISITSYFTPSVMVYPQNTTTYSVEVRDSRECISLPRLVTVTVLPRPVTAIAIPTINNVATNTVCYVGQNPGAIDVTINLTGVNLNPGLQFGVVPTYTWVSPYPANYNSILTPANNNAVTVAAPIRELNNNAVVVYTLISGYNGIPGCRRVDTVSVRVVDCRPVRSIKFTTAQTNDTICVRTCVTFVNQTDTMAGGPQKLLWKFEGGSPATSTVNLPTVCYNFPGPYDVILQVSNPYPVINPTGGAPGSTLTIGTLNFIKVVDVPNVTIIPPGQLHSDTTIRFGQTVDLSGSGAVRYNWSPAYNISSISNPNVKVSPSKTTQYILTGFNSKQCSSSDTINVNVTGLDSCESMYVPNAFTPNNDGTNDVLYVRGICLESLSFMIFNRWGEKIFETTDQKNGWDGSYKGVDLDTGVFVYRLEGKDYKGGSFSSKGNITLLR